MLGFIKFIFIIYIYNIYFLFYILYIFVLCISHNVPTFHLEVHGIDIVRQILIKVNGKSISRVRNGLMIESYDIMNFPLKLILTT